MAQRYVRVQTTRGRIYYGLLQPNHAVQVFDAPPWLNGQPTDRELPAEEYKLLAPCAPSKIVAVGKNYPAHAKEMGSEVPQEPLLFLKAPTAVIGPDEAIVYPPQTQQVDYEGELALVIGDICEDCSPEEAASKIWGYTIANDVTARDLQRKDPLWTRAKGFNTFCPLGPWIVRELNPGAKIQTFLNDEEEPRQCAPIDRMVFSCDSIVSYVSKIMTLLPGDVVLTGTPRGIGSMQPGDRVQVELEGIGVLSNFVVAKSVPSPEETLPHR
ncbi:MAG: fumarylacetoacetate hydrolase family protein [Cyanobacteria bacterium SID2]|nr:fumarylacetoacetate hydrolase family protein [Cyanobacteria bacterium SID2]MBP0004761.1 fumarylacetoacetate hydrolase family protein [Cyanobacteria bacterium SBC]